MRIKKPAAVIAFVCGLVALGFAAQDQQLSRKLAALEKIQGKFTFVVLGDNRSGDDIYRTLVAQIVERKSDFVINTGDVIDKPGSKDEWARFWLMSKPITVPYFLAVGNHDAHPKVPLSEKTYRDEVDLPGNELYYSFSAGNSLFIVLDSFIEGQEKRVTGEQFAWLEGVLAKSGARHTFVFLHHPLFTEAGKGRHAGDNLDKYPQDRDKLEALLVKARVDAVFSGHEHYYQRKTVNGITQVIAGGGGAPMYEKEEDGGFFHTVTVTVDGEKVNAEVTDINGKVRDRFRL